jgi:hypothetical protein
METTTIRLAISDLPDKFDPSRMSLVLDVLGRVLSEATGATIEAFADSFTISIAVPTNRLYAAATALREMRLI